MKSLTLLPLLVVGLAASPALAQAPVLVYSTKGDFAYLDYNPPGAAAPAVKMACSKGSGELDIAQYGQSAGDKVKFSSGAAMDDLAASKANGSRGDFLKIHTKTDNKVLGQFRQSGKLDLAGQGFTTQITAEGGDAKRDLEQFFIACEDREE